VPTAADSNNNNNNNIHPQVAASSTQSAAGSANRRGEAPDPPEVVTAPTSSGEEAAQKVRSRLIRLQNHHREREKHRTGGNNADGGSSVKSLSSSAMDNHEHDNSPRSYTKFVEDGSSNSNNSRGSFKKSLKNDISNKQQLERILNETVSEDMNEIMDDDDEDFPSVSMDPIESDEEGEDNKYYESAPNSPMMQSPNDDYRNNAPSSAPMNSNRSSNLSMKNFLSGKGEQFRPPFSNDGKLNSQKTNNLDDGLERFAPPYKMNSKPGYTASRSMPVDPLLSDGIDILEHAAKQAQAKEEVETLNDSINYLRNLQLADQSSDTSEQQHLAQVHRDPVSTPQDEDYIRPVPRKLSSNPAADHIKKGRFLTAEEAMNYVMNQSNRTGAISGGEESINQAANDINKAYAFLNNMTSEEIVEFGLTGRAKVVMDSFDNSDQVSLEEEEDDEFERNTSLSMHAEEKFGAAMGSSRHAEEKQRQQQYARKIDAGTNDYDDNDTDGVSHSLREFSDGNLGSGIAWAVDHHASDSQLHRPRRTSLPTTDPPSSDRGNSMSASWTDESGRRLSYPDEYSSNNNAALGPRNKKPGGVTGVNLGEYAKSPQQYQDDKLDSFSEHSLNSDGHKSAEDEGYTTPPEYGDVDFQSTGLMTVLCGHLLPLKFDDSLQNEGSLCGIASMFVQNSQNQKPAWNDEDPDEPGYVVHQLSNAELNSVEYAFEQIMTAYGESAAVNNNFERDLEEAEKVLDEDEKRHEAETKGLSPLKDSGDSASPGTQDSYADAEALSYDGDEMRECVPDFPGIFPPGKGRQGELECFYLPVITKSQKTGFEPTKDLVLKPGSVFANNYLVQGELGSAAFSTAYRCVDLASEEDEDGYQDEVCLKVIKNTKDYFDQSIDEIKILRLLKDTGKVQENNIVEMKSFFYHREHLVIVTELLRQNMYEFGKSIIESRGPAYFTRDRLSHITRQCLIALKFVHELGLMHCDIKPEVRRFFTWNEWLSICNIILSSPSLANH